MLTQETQVRANPRERVFHKVEEKLLHYQDCFTAKAVEVLEHGYRPCTVCFSDDERGRFLLELTHSPAKPKEKDVTLECTVELVRRMGAEGYYIKLPHKGKPVLALGLKPGSYYSKSDDYKVVPAEGSTISFRVVKNASS